MGDATGIEWTDATWNPVVGCSVVSPGCTNCYAMSMAARIERMQPGSHYAGTTQPSKAAPVWTGKLALAPEHILLAPLRWRKPRRIFVNSMGDLFHEDVPDGWIDQVFAIMALTPQHTFQVLTKRSARMRDYCSDPSTPGRIARVIIDKMMIEKAWPFRFSVARWPIQSVGDTDDPDDITVAWPLRNVWKGVSTEDQRRADERVPDLLATPAAIRFVSAEPLLGKIDFCLINPVRDERGAITAWLDALRGLQFGSQQHTTAKLDQIIVGGESGPRARPMHPYWARLPRDECAVTGTAFFLKQWGEWASIYDRDRDDPDWRHVPKPGDWDRKRWLNLAGGQGFHGDKLNMMRRVGKHAAGRLLDGVEHNAMPEVRHG